MRIAILFMLCIILVSCKKEDTQSPVLELLGSDMVVQWLPSTAGSGYYFDAGVTARDNEDGNITANVLVENLVNPNRKGTYTVTYTVQDEAGNPASIQRIVQIINSAESFAGTYLNCADTCTASTLAYQTTIASSDTVNRLVWISNFSNAGNNIRIRATLSDTNVTVPLNQYLDLSMTKYINTIFSPQTDILSAVPPTKFRIKYSWTDGTNADTCTSWLQR